MRLLIACFLINSAFSYESTFNKGFSRSQRINEVEEHLNKEEKRINDLVSENKKNAQEIQTLRNEIETLKSSNANLNQGLKEQAQIISDLLQKVKLLEEKHKTSVDESSSNSETSF